MIIVTMMIIIAAGEDENECRTMSLQLWWQQRRETNGGVKGKEKHQSGEHDCEQKCSSDGGDDHSDCEHKCLL